MILLALIPMSLSAQRTLSLEECRKLALEGNKTLSEQRAKVEMARYDTYIAAANYFPKVSATGTYQHTGGGFSLIDDTSIPQFASLIADSRAMEVISGMADKNIGEAIMGIGREVDEVIDDAIHPDISNICLGVLSVQQPVFVGGKIIASNKMAGYASELAEYEYEGSLNDVVSDVDAAYWQVVSVAGKKQLAQSYSQLLHKMKGNVEAAVREGVATEADLLSVSVKCNEADMALTKATNGLVLAKMLLCKRTGLPLDSDIVLADEGTDDISQPLAVPEKDIEDVISDRSETKRLDLARKIYVEKVNIARADMMPAVALTANYAVMNPNMNHGFRNSFGSNWAVGVVVKVPIFHGTEALQKTRKAKAEATIYESKYDDACELIRLQVTQLRQQRKEAAERLGMSRTNLESADENLRMANLGYEAGVVDVNTAMGAHTAWLKAHSEYIDAGVDLRLKDSALRAALGDRLYSEPIE